MGAELGHMQVVPEGRLCGCGNLGCWEQYASGNALVDRRQGERRGRPERAAQLLEIAGGTPTSSRATRSPRPPAQGDPAALAAFASIAQWLGQGLADLAAILDPGCFILGGGVSRAADLGSTRPARPSPRS